MSWAWIWHVSIEPHSQITTLDCGRETSRPHSGRLSDPMPCLSICPSSDPRPVKHCPVLVLQAGAWLLRTSVAPSARALRVACAGWGFGGRLEVRGLALSGWR